MFCDFQLGTTWIWKGDTTLSANNFKINWDKSKNYMSVEKNFSKSTIWEFAELPSFFRLKVILLQT